MLASVRSLTRVVPKATAASSRNLYTVLKNSDDLDAMLKKDNVLIQFSASWCMPCKMASPKVEAMTKDLTQVHTVYVDIDEHSEIAEEHGVASVPMFLAFKKGVPSGKVLGGNIPAIEALVTKLNQ